MMTIKQAYRILEMELACNSNDCGGDECYGCPLATTTQEEIVEAYKIALSCMKNVLLSREVANNK